MPSSSVTVSSSPISGQRTTTSSGPSGGSGLSHHVLVHRRRPAAAAPGVEDQVAVASAEPDVARPPAVGELHAEQEARAAAAVVPEELAEAVGGAGILRTPGAGGELERHARRVGLHTHQRDRDVRRPDEQPVHRQRRRQLVLRPAHPSLEVRVAVAEGAAPHGAEPVGPTPARQAEESRAGPPARPRAAPSRGATMRLARRRPRAFVLVEEAPMAFGWKLYGDGKTLPLGEAVAPDERLSWPRTVGIGAQHVVAMFGATFVFPLLMGLDPNLAIMMSGVATILFLLIVQGKVPSYLGSSRLVRRRRRRGARRGRLGRRRPRCAARVRRRPRAGRPGHPPRRRPGGQPGPAAGGHRRRGHAHRLQPRPGGDGDATGSRTSGSRWRPWRSSSSPRCCCAASWPASRSCWAWCSATCCRSCSTRPRARSPRRCRAEPARRRRGRLRARGPYCVATAFPHDRVSFDAVGDAPWFGLPDFTGPRSR